MSKMEGLDVSEYDKEAFLTSASSIYEAEIIEGLLNTNNIPVLKKVNNADGYLSIYMGATNCGVDLFVPSKLLEEAKDIISANKEIEGENVIESESSDLDKFKKKQRIRTWIILLIFIPGFSWVVIGILNYLFQWFDK